MSNGRIKLQDVINVTNRLEDKIEKRFDGLEKQVFDLGIEVSNLKGKASTLSVLGSYGLSAISLVLQAFRRNP